MTALMVAEFARPSEYGLIGATISCSVPGCNQRFSSQQALALHMKFMHDSENTITKKDVGYELVYEFKGAQTVMK